MAHLFEEVVDASGAGVLLGELGAAGQGGGQVAGGLTPRGHRQCQWLRTALKDLAGHDPYVYASQYRRALDTAELALPGRAADVTVLLNEQHYGDATYMTKRELFTTWPESQVDRQTRKHLWTPPGQGSESLAVGVLRRATAFVAGVGESAPAVVAMTHHTAILALRSVLEGRPVTELVDEAPGAQDAERGGPGLRAARRSEAAFQPSPAITHQLVSDK
ncbi:histidine phosphatase family protein [Streptomyces sp. TE33382]